MGVKKGEEEDEVGEEEREIRGGRRVVKIKLYGGRQMNAAEEDGGREEGRHMQRRGWQMKKGGEK